MRSLGVLFGLAIAATVAIALWLAWVVTVVVPLHDPAHRALWSGIAVALFAYGAVCAGYLRRPTRTVLRAVVLAASIAIGLAGAYGVVAMLGRAHDPARFEGYVLLMGAALVTHASIAIAYTIGGVRRG